MEPAGPRGRLRPAAPATPRLREPAAIALPRARTLAEAFDPQRNSFTFVRLVLAAMVILSHAFSLGGFGHDWLYRWGENDSFGSLAVAAFFTLSGFLVTRSYCESGSLLRYSVHRVLRIFPGYWACLAVTALLLSPLVYFRQHDSLAGFFAPGPQNPWRYLLVNFWLEVHQADVAGVCARTSAGGWNVSIWTLLFEFQCYILVAALGWAGLLQRRRGSALIVLAVVFLLRLFQVVQPSSAGFWHPVLTMWLVRLGLSFVIGMAAYLYREQVLLDRRLAVFAVVLAVAVGRFQGWSLVAPFATAYLTFYFGVSPRLAFWDRVGDYSYGIYLYGSVVQQGLVFAGINAYGFYPFLAASFVVVAPAGVLSYRLVERPAIRLGRRILSWYGALAARSAEERAALSRPATQAEASGVP